MSDFKYIIRQNKGAQIKRSALPSVRSRIMNGTMPVRDGIDMLLFGIPSSKIVRS